MGKKPKKSKAPEPVRYHLMDTNPFTVVTEEGPVQLGLGWLVITEAEYLQLRGRPEISPAAYKKLLKRPDISLEEIEELRARPSITERQLKALKNDRDELRSIQDRERDAYLAKPFYTEEDLANMTPQGHRRIR